MRINKILEVFEEIENDKDLIQLFNVGDTNAWVHVKFEIYKTNMNLSQVNKKSKFKISFIGLLISHLLRLFTSKSKINLFFGLSRGIVKSNSGNLVDVYMLEEVKKIKSTGYFMTLNSFEELEKNKKFINENNIVYDNLLFNFYKKSFGRFVKLPYVDFSEIEKKFSTAGFKVDNTFVSAIVHDFYVRFKFYSWLIRRFKKAKSAFIVSAYSKSYITAALQKNNIHVSEIQHGLIGQTHYGYNYSCNLNSIIVPDRFFVYNDFWKKEMAKCNFTRDVKLYANYRYNNIFPLENKINRDYILFTGQGILYQQIMKFMEDGVDFLKKKKLTLIYKAHPAENMDFCPIKELCSKYEELIFNEFNYSTEYMIKNSIAHISVQSSCHFDAIEIIGETNIVNFENVENNLNEYCLSYPNKFFAINNLSEVKIV